MYKKDVVSSVTTEILYLHDGMNAIVERNKTGTPTEYIYGPTGIIAIKTPASMHYVITSGLHNFKARMYDSDIGRFYGDDPAAQFASGYIGLGNSPVNGTDPTGLLFGIDDAIVSGLAFVTGYTLYGFKTGDWGSDALVAGGVAAGSAWLAYNTGGAAAGALAKKGTVAYSAINGAVGGAVGGGFSSTANQLIYRGEVDFGQVGSDALTNFGGGLFAGGFGEHFAQIGGKYPFHHVVKHLIRSSFYDLGAYAFSGGKRRGNYGLDESIVFPAFADAFYISSEFWGNKAKDRILKNSNLPKNAIKVDANIRSIDLEFGFHEDKFYLFSIEGEVTATIPIPVERSFDAGFGKIHFKGNIIPPPVKFGNKFYYGGVNYFTSYGILNISDHSYILNYSHLNYLRYWR